MPRRISPEDLAPYIRDAGSIVLQPPCGNCEYGHRRICGIHVPSQRKGMIPETPCDAIFVCKGGSPNQTLTFKGGPGRQWQAWVDGEILRDKRGAGRRFAYATSALKAARKASQDRGAA